MDNEEITKWIEDEIVYQSLERLYYLFSEERDDSFGWGNMLKAQLDCPAEILRTKSGLLIVGENGCGKHTAAYNAVEYLCSGYAKSEDPEDAQYECVFLSSLDLEAVIKDFRNVYEYLNALLDYFEGKKLCLVVEDINDNEIGKEFYRRLGQFVCMYKAREELAHLYVIIIAEDEKNVPSVLRERLTLCRLLTPNPTARLNFLRAQYAFLSTVKKYLGEDSTDELCGEIAELTEGTSYSQLKDIAASAELYLRCGGEDILEFVKTQLPFKPEPERSDNSAINMQELLVQLAGIKAQSAEPEEEKPKNDFKVAQKTAEPTREEMNDQIGNMTGFELAADLFSKEEAERLVEKGRKLQNG